MPTKVLTQNIKHHNISVLSKESDIDDFFFRKAATIRMWIIIINNDHNNNNKFITTIYYCYNFYYYDYCDYYKLLQSKGHFQTGSLQMYHSLAEYDNNGITVRTRAGHTFKQKKKW